MLDDAKGHAQVDERGDGHVAGYSAERIQEEDLALTGVLGERFTVNRRTTTLRSRTPAMARRRVAMVIVIVVVVVMGGLTSLLQGASGGSAGPPTSRTTAIAAPKPLSMFTTVTPDAHDDSIPKSGVSPPSDAP
jgi:hypothetical protein